MNAPTATPTHQKRQPRALPEPVITRVDFFRFNEQAYTGVDRECWRVVKFAEGWTAHTPPVDVRVNPTLRTVSGEEPFDIERALSLLERAGWQVRRWRGGARAWKGELLPAADLAALGPDERDLLVTLLRWGTAPELQASESFASWPQQGLLIQNLPDLHGALRAGSSGYCAIEVPLPDRDARLRFIAWSLATRPIASDLEPDELANVTAGLSLIHLENVRLPQQGLQAELEGRLTRDLVRRHKAQLIQQEYAPCRSRYCSKCSTRPTASRRSAAWSRSSPGRLARSGSTPSR